jgi:hypothetical protein
VGEFHSAGRVGGAANGAAGAERLTIREWMDV